MPRSLTGCHSNKARKGSIRHSSLQLQAPVSSQARPRSQAADRATLPSPFTSLLTFLEGLQVAAHLSRPSKGSAAALSGPGLDSVVVWPGQ